jgi:hypothetical protein
MRKPSALVITRIYERDVGCNRFFLLVGLLILRMIEEQRREGQRTKVEDPSHSVEGTFASHATLETPHSPAPDRVTV